MNHPPATTPFAHSSCLALGLLLGACSAPTPPPPEPPPPVAIQIGYFAGSLLRGAVLQPPAAPTPLEQVLNCTAFRLQSMPAAAKSLESGAQLVLRTESELLRGTTDLRDARFLRGMAATPMQNGPDGTPMSTDPAGTTHGLLAPGTTTVLRVPHEDSMPTGEIELRFEPTDGGAGLRLGVSRPQAGTPSPDLVLLDVAPSLSSPLLLLIPWRGGSVLGLRLSIDPVTITADRVNTWRAALNAASKNARQQAAQMLAPAARRRELGQALAQLGDKAHRRAALLLLAETTGAQLAESLGLAGDEAVLQRIADSVKNNDESKLQPKTLGWCLERQSYLALIPEDEEKMPLQHRGMLLRFAGALADSLDTLQALLTEASSLKDFQERIHKENEIALQDSSLAQRVHALDWLEARGLAPTGFDPGASRKDRRRVLESWQQQQQAPTKKDTGSTARR